MDFFRQNKKVIVGLIAVSFIVWTIGMGLLLIIPSIIYIINANNACNIANNALICYFNTIIKNRVIHRYKKTILYNFSYEFNQGKIIGIIGPSGSGKSTLLSMIDWNEELRSRIGVMNYIHQRTRISRSVVAEVLAALRKGGYIEMNKGKLVAINRLPSEY